MIITIKVSNRRPSKGDIDKVKTILNLYLSKNINNKTVIFEDNELLAYFNLNYDSTIPSDVSVYIIKDIISLFKSNNVNIDTNDILLIRREQKINNTFDVSIITKTPYIFYVTTDKLDHTDSVMIGKIRVNVKRVYIDKYIRDIYKTESSQFITGKEDMIILYRDNILQHDILYRFYADGEIYMTNIDNIGPIRHRLPSLDSTIRLKRRINLTPFDVYMEPSVEQLIGASVGNSRFRSFDKISTINIWIDKPVIVESNGLKYVLYKNMAYQM